MYINRKLKGSVLLETIVALMIISTTISILGKLVVEANKNITMRNERELLSRVLYCIKEELKYNYSYEDILILDNSTIYLAYNNDFLEELTTKELLTMPIGNDIEINFRNEKNNEMKIDIRISKNIYNTVIEGEEEFEKVRWMDEVFQ